MPTVAVEGGVMQWATTLEGSFLRQSSNLSSEHSCKRKGSRCVPCLIDHSLYVCISVYLSLCVATDGVGGVSA